MKQRPSKVGGWVVRLTKEGKEHADEMVAAANGVEAGLAVRDLGAKQHGLGFQWSLDTKLVVVSDPGGVTSREQLFTMLGIEDAQAMELVTSMHSTTLDGKAVLILNLDRGASKADVTALIQSSSEITAHYIQMLFKGWDAFPCMRRDWAGFGESVAAAMVHFGIDGMPWSTWNTWVTGLIMGDDTRNAYQQLDDLCKLREQYEDLCKNPRSFKIPKKYLPHVNDPDAEGAEDVHVSFCGPTVTDAKAACAILGHASFKPYICHVCKYTWLQGTKHCPPMCAKIDRTGSKPYYAGLVNIYNAAYFQQSLKLEAALHHARKIPEILDGGVQSTSSSMNAGGEDPTRIQGRLLKKICHTIKTQISGGQPELKALKSKCEKAAAAMDPGPLQDSNLGTLLGELDDHSAVEVESLLPLLDAPGQTPERRQITSAAPLEERFRREAIGNIRKFVSVSLDAPSTDERYVKHREVTAAVMSKTGTSVVPSQHLAGALWKAYTQAKDHSYFKASSVKLHDGGLAAVAKEADWFFDKLVHGMPKMQDIPADTRSEWEDIGRGIAAPKSHPPELQAALRAGIAAADAVKTAMGSDEDLLATVHTVLGDLGKVMPKSKDTAKLRQKMNVAEGLDGILWPSLLESGGWYYPGILHQGARACTHAHS